MHNNSPSFIVYISAARDYADQDIDQLNLLYPWTGVYTTLLQRRDLSDCSIIFNQ